MLSKHVIKKIDGTKLRYYFDSKAIQLNEQTFQFRYDYKNKSYTIYIRIQYDESVIRINWSMYDKESVKNNRVLFDIEKETKYVIENIVSILKNTPKYRILIATGRIKLVY